MVPTVRGPPNEMNRDHRVVTGIKPDDRDQTGWLGLMVKLDPIK